MVVVCSDAGSKDTGRVEVLLLLTIGFADIPDPVEVSLMELLKEKGGRERSEREDCFKM